MPNDCQEKAREEVEELYTVVFYYVFPVLITTGIITNGLNLIVLTRPTMRSRTYRWLRALAFVDLCLCVLTVPVCLACGGNRPYNSWSLVFYYAHFGWSLSIAAQILSFYLMGMFAFERFLAVCRHDLYPRSQTDEVYRRGVAAATIVVLLVYLPTMVVGRVLKVEEGLYMPLDGYSKQLRYSDWYPTYAWFRELFSRLLPALVITYCNVRITLRLRHMRNIREGFGKGVPATRRERERRLVLLLFCFTALFYVFNTPVIIYYLGFLHTKSRCDNDSAAKVLIFAAISNLLQMMGNVSNFVLYFLISPEFHDTLCALLSCKATGLLAGIKMGSVRNHRKTLAISTITSTASSINIPAAAAATGMTEEESPTQSDSGYHQDLSVTPPRRSSSASAEGRGPVQKHV